MKKLLVTSLFLFISTAVLSAKMIPEDLFKFDKISGGNDSLEIIQNENDWGNALINKDESICRKYLADGLIYSENDKQYNRDDVIQSVLSTTETVEKAYNEEMQVYLFGNTAVATGWLIVEGISSDGKFKRKYRYTDVWLKTENNWQIIAAHDYLMQ